MEKISLDINKNFELLRTITAGTPLLISGKIYTARDAAHKRIERYLQEKKEINFDFTNKIIYYMGPTPNRENYPIGSCGPTSSYRMDSHLEMMCKLGILATIGKGTRSKIVNELAIKYKVPYLLTIGGAGAYLATKVKSSKLILFEDLGSEAIFELEVADFPVIVGIDFQGNQCFC